MRLPASAKWVLLALAGLAIAIGVAIAAANLTSQQIGIASESVSAGDVLAPSLRTPAGGSKAGGREGERGPSHEGQAPTGPVEPAGSEEEAAPPSESAEPPAEQGTDDYGGSGGGDD